LVDGPTAGATLALGSADAGALVVDTLPTADAGTALAPLTAACVPRDMVPVATLFGVDDVEETSVDGAAAGPAPTSALALVAAEAAGAEAEADTGAEAEPTSTLALVGAVTAAGADAEG